MARIEVGRKAFTLQTVPAQEEGEEDRRLAKARGFSLHAGVAAQAHQRRKLERLHWYIAVTGGIDRTDGVGEPGEYSLCRERIH